MLPASLLSTVLASLHADNMQLGDNKFPQRKTLRNHTLRSRFHPPWRIEQNADASRDQIASAYALLDTVRLLVYESTDGDALRDQVPLAIAQDSVE
jgi:hypothetical protein